MTQSREPTIEKYDWVIDNNKSMSNFFDPHIDPVLAQKHKQAMLSKRQINQSQEPTISKYDWVIDDNKKSPRKRPMLDRQLMD